MHLFAFILLSVTLDQAMQLVNAVIQIFGDPYNTDSQALLQHFLNIGLDDSTTKIIYEDEDDGQQQQQEQDPLEVDETKISSEAIIHQSPFNIEARKQIPDVVNLLDSSTKYNTITNPLFSRSVIRTTYRWFAYLPLWSSLMLDFEERHVYYYFTLQLEMSE
ncbi:unnamed protein product [Didymodactylos carnosus]|uniref:Uncharacterized protein n=1 Tax=Didymodactylos carnosus TaxID=1234261 RepID=A0A815ZPJ4_9BILA|nr:unnamed protein product [Didymodactylos carnosus]CAF4458607.1 unnamed protein product [Didymodactylos carnosus]